MHWTYTDHQPLVMLRIIDGKGYTSQIGEGTTPNLIFHSCSTVQRNLTIRITLSDHSDMTNFTETYLERIHHQDHDGTSTT